MHSNTASGAGGGISTDHRPAARRAAVVVAVAFAAFAGLLLLFFPFTADDAYITARYAENLIDRGELAFNAGDRISALTSPLHALVEAGLYAVSGHTILGNKVLAIALVAGTYAWACRRLWRADGPAAAAAFAALAVPSPFVAVWAVGGLETPYLLVLLTWLTFLCRPRAAAADGADPARGDPFTTARVAAAGLLAGLAFVARFDSVTYTAPVVLYVLARSPSRPRAAAALVPGAAVAVAWLAFAKLYFHDFLPTSFYLKTPSGAVVGLMKTGLYLFQFAVLSGLGLAAVIAARAAGLAAVRRTTAGRWGLYGGAALFLAYALTAATHHMMFSYRLLVPLVPTLAVLLVDLLPAARPAAAAVAAAPARPWFRPVALVGLVAFQAALGGYAWRFSMNPGIVGESKRNTYADYVHAILPALGDAADAMRDDWRLRPPAGPPRPMRMYTFAGGVPPYQLRDAFVFEALVTHHHDPRCADHMAWRRQSDYVMLSAGDDPAAVRAALPGPPERYELIYSRRVFYETWWNVQVYRHFDPDEKDSPPYADQPCRAAAGH